MTNEVRLSKVKIGDLVRFETMSSPRVVISLDLLDLKPTVIRLTAVRSCGTIVTTYHRENEMVERL